MKKQLTVEQKLRKLIREEYTKLQIQKFLEDTWYEYKDGRKDKAPRLIDEDDIRTYIEGKLKNIKVSSATIKERNKTYPYNRADMYSHNIWTVTLDNGLTFEFDIYQGEPRWSGNVVYTLGVSIR